MGNTEQLDNIAQKVDAVGRQVDDVSKKVNEVWVAQQGNDTLGAPGLMRRVDNLEDTVTEIETQLKTWNTQMRFISWAAGSGGIGGIAALIWTLIQAFSQGG